MGKHKHCECYIHEHKENIRLKRIIKEKDRELGQKDKAIEQLSSENAELKKVAVLRESKLTSAFQFITMETAEEGEEGGEERR